MKISIAKSEAFSLATGSHPVYKLIQAGSGPAITHVNVLERKSDKKLFEFLFVFLPERSKYHGDINAYIFNDLNLYEVEPYEKTVIEYKRIWE